MGACFGSIYDIALGDLDASEAGSASGSLSAVQQPQERSDQPPIFFAATPQRRPQPQ